MRAFALVLMQERKPKSTLAVAAIFVVILILVLIFAGRTAVWAQAAAQGEGTQVSGNISANTTWTIDKSPYRVTGLLRVLTGVTLTIEPGVVVEVAKGVPVVIQGGLIAQATLAQPILFTGATKVEGAWNGILVGNTPETPALLDFRYVTVEYGSLAGQFDGGNLQVISKAMVKIEDSTFRQGGANGINAMLNSSLEISDTAFLDNQLAAIRLTGSVDHDPILSNLHAEGNGANVILYTSVNLGAGAHTLALPGLALPYRLQGGFTVAKDSHLIVQPGVEMQLDTGFYVYGELTALGSAELPIRFTRKDSNAGNWWGLSVTGGFEQPTKAELDHVIIEYGGQPNGIGDGNLVVNNAVVTVTNSIINEGGKNGIENQGGLPTQPHSLYVADTKFTNNQGSAIRCNQGSCRQSFHNLSAGGNGFDGIAQQGIVTENVVWQNIGLPYLIETYSGISQGTLTIEPGSEIRFAKDATFSVSGSLIAVGTPTEPITFTGTQPQPGWWQGIQLGSSGFVVELRYCDIGYGGATVGSQPAALLTFGTSSVLVSNCRLHHSAGPAIRTGGGQVPTIRYSRIEDNAFGVQAGTHDKQSFFRIDARDNWWGAASGPTHASNPNGTGAKVSDGVQFDPWLTSPEQSSTSDLAVTIVGLGRYAPGQTAQYGIHYNNSGSQLLKDAVLRLAMPGNSDYVDSNSGGIFWPDRRQVFWKLGDLAPGANGVLVVTIRYDWGLPEGLTSTLAAQLSGSNIAPQPFALADYLNYKPRFITSEVEVSKAQADAERTSNHDLDAIYTLATGKGYVYGSSTQQTYNTGDVINQTILLKFQPQMSAFFLWSHADNAVGVAVDGSSFTVYKSNGAVRYDLSTDQWQDLGATSAAVDGKAWKTCMTNCIEEKLPSYIIKKYIKILSTISKVISCYAAINGGEAKDIASCSKLLAKAIPGYGEAIDLGICNTDCIGCEQAGRGCDDDRCHCCTEDKYRCSEDDWLYGTLGIDVVKKKPCDPRTGEYLAEQVVKVCALCEKCILTANGPNCMQKEPQTFVSASGLQAATTALPLLNTAFTIKCEECRTALDPNEMEGAEGDLLPGQLLTYTIDYENIGAGEAFGVFIVNELSEYFDLSTLHLPEGAVLSVASHTVYFPVANLAPKGQAGSQGKITYSVRLKGDLPSGSVITNQAVVHFPSVPQETPTNSVINVIQPIAVTPLTLATGFEQPLAIELHGQDAANSPLTFVVSGGFLYGALTGTPPHLRYQPAPGFTGVDHFSFTAGNGVETSNPTAVTIQVGAATNDTKSPTIRWTAPANGAVVGPSVALAPGSADALYTPRFQIQFSEEMDARTVTTATIQIKDSGGQSLPVRVGYDPSVDQAVALLQEPLQANTTYTIVVMGAVADLAGNRLGADYAWSIRTGASVGASSRLFLPVLQR